MKEYSVSVVRADESWGYATITYSESSTVTVEITGINSAGSAWRIRGRASLGDNTTYLSGNGLGTYTFKSDNNKSYIFQIQNWNNDWVNTTNAYGEEVENSIFSVVFESDGGGESGGGSADSGTAYCNVSDDYGYSLSAVVSWSSGPEVIVDVTCNNRWRLVNYNSGEVILLDDDILNESYSNTFNAIDGESYIFQMKNMGWSEEEFVDNGIAVSGFTVDFFGNDDNTGGDGVNSTLKTCTVTALGVTAQVTYTSGPEVTITILSWDGYNSIPYWRVKGRASQGDTNTYLAQTNASSDSFDSVDLGHGDGYDDGGKEYTFQVCKNGNWNNDGGEDSIFLVDFSLGGDDSGGGSDSVTPCGYLIVNQGEGTKLHIQRIWPSERTCYEDLETGDPIYMDGEDTFFVSVEVLDGYELDYYSFYGVQLGYHLDNFVEFEPNGRPPEDTNIYYQVGSYGNATVTSTATPIASVRIYNNNISSWNKYVPYIYDGSNWNKYRPYIYSNSNWNKYN